MKLADYARKMGIHYQTALKLWDEGKLKGKRLSERLIIIDDSELITSKNGVKSGEELVVDRAVNLEKKVTVEDRLGNEAYKDMLWAYIRLQTSRIVAAIKEEPDVLDPKVSKNMDGMVKYLELYAKVCGFVKEGEKDSGFHGQVREMNRFIGVMKGQNLDELKKLREEQRLESTPGRKKKNKLSG